MIRWSTRRLEKDSLVARRIPYPEADLRGARSELCRALAREYSLLPKKDIGWIHPYLKVFLDRIPAYWSHVDEFSESHDKEHPHLLILYNERRGDWCFLQCWRDDGVDIVDMDYVTTDPNALVELLSSEERNRLFGAPCEECSKQYCICGGNFFELLGQGRDPTIGEIRDALTFIGVPDVHKETPIEGGPESPESQDTQETQDTQEAPQRGYGPPTECALDDEMRLCEEATPSETVAPPDRDTAVPPDITYPGVGEGGRIP